MRTDALTSAFRAERLRPVSRTVAAAAAVAVLLVAAGCGGREKDAAGSYASLDPALKEAKASNKPILLEFGGPW